MNDPSRRYANPSTPRTRRRGCQHPNESHSDDIHAVFVDARDPNRTENWCGACLWHDGRKCDGCLKGMSWDAMVEVDGGQYWCPKCASQHLVTCPECGKTTNDYYEVCVTPHKSNEVQQWCGECTVKNSFSCDICLTDFSSAHESEHMLSHRKPKPIRSNPSRSPRLDDDKPGYYARRALAEYRLRGE